MFVRQDWLPGALSTLGTIVNGVGIKWVYERRMEAVKEEEEAYKHVEEICAKEIAPEKVKQQLREATSKNLLFGKFR